MKRRGPIMVDDIAAAVGREFVAALRECARWGVRVVQAPEPPGHGRGWSDGPVMGGIHWPTRTIYLTGEPGHDWPCALIHELAHVLSAEKPNSIDEPYSEMLAIEAEAARRLRLEWASWMHYYTADDGTDWPRLSSRRRGEMLADSRAMARRRGILDDKGRPTYRLPRDTRRAIMGAR